MSATWGLYHNRHGFMGAFTVAMFYADPIRIRNVNGRALMDTRETARTVLRKLEQADVPVDGYVPTRAVVDVVPVDAINKNDKRIGRKGDQ